MDDRGAPRPDAEILAARIGQVEPLNGPIQLDEYSPEWPAAYLRFADSVRDALGATVRRLEHVGSTSVPGLAAKPIIDMLLVVEDSADESAYVPPLEAAAWVLRVREPDWHEHRLLKPPAGRANLHVFTEGSQEIDRMLVFRDRLRSDDRDRARYEAAKRELAARTWKYTQHYADAKSEIVESILADAMAARR